MKTRSILPVVLVVLFVAGLVRAYEVPLGVVASTDGGSFNNLSPFYQPALYPDAGPYIDGGVTTDGGGTFVLASGIKLSVQCDMPACVRACSTGVSCASTCARGLSTTGVYLGSEMLFDVPVDQNTNAISQRPFVGNPDGGNVYCQVFQVLP